MRVLWVLVLMIWRIILQLTHTCTLAKWRGFGLFGNSINTGNIATNMHGFICDHKSCAEGEFLSNFDTKESVNDETNSNCDTKEKVDNSYCDTCLVEDESVRLSGMNSIPFYAVNYDHMCQPFCLENDFCDIDSIQDSTLEDMVSCSNSNKPSEFQKNLSDRLCYGEHAHMHRLCPFP